MSLEIKIVKNEYWWKTALLILAGIFWMVVVGLSFTKLYNFEFISGPTDVIAQQWPQATIIPRDNHLFQLIMFAHPQCSCTNATMSELEEIMAHTQGKVKTYVLFVQLKLFNEQWVKSDLFKTTGRIPGVQVMIDDEAKQAKLFGGTTSGQVFLYNPQGQLVFMGGITASRGHSGDNAGQSAIIDLINNRPTKVHRTPFFGCLLYDRANNKRGP
jgi:hypothetical protein